MLDSGRDGTGGEGEGKGFQGLGQEGGDELGRRKRRRRGGRGEKRADEDDVVVWLFLDLFVAELDRILVRLHLKSSWRERRRGVSSRARALLRDCEPQLANVEAGAVGRGWWIEERERGDLQQIGVMMRYSVDEPMSLLRARKLLMSPCTEDDPAILHKLDLGSAWLVTTQSSKALVRPSPFFAELAVARRRHSGWWCRADGRASSGNSFLDQHPTLPRSPG